MIINNNPLNTAEVNGGIPVVISLSMAEAISFADTVIFNMAYWDSRNDSFSLSEQLVYDYGAALIESVRFAEAVSTNASLWSRRDEYIRFKDTLKNAWELVISESLDVTDDTSLTFTVGRILQVAFRLSDYTSSAGSSINLNVAELLALRELVRGVDELTINDQLNLIATEGFRAKWRARTSEILELLETDDIAVAFQPVQREMFNFDDLTTSQISVLEGLIENLLFLVEMVDGNEIYTGWVMNTKNLGVTSYSNYEFTGFHKMGGKQLAVGRYGLYELNGTDDDGTNVAVTLSSGMYDFGRGKQSRLESMYFGVLTDQKFVLKTLTGDGTERWYESELPSSGLDSVRVKLGKGVKSRYWKWTLATQQNASFYMDSVEMLPVILNRRIK